MSLAQGVPDPVANGAVGSLHITDGTVNFSTGNIIPTTLNGLASTSFSPPSIKEEPEEPARDGEKSVKTKQKRNKPTLSCLYVVPPHHVQSLRIQFTSLTAKGNALSEKRNAIEGGLASRA